MTLQARRHGRAGPWVVAVHGGPGTPGSAAPLARGLADGFRVLEPFQRRAGGAQPLTVRRHVEDLDEAVRSLGDKVRPAVVGHSWGAMLALAWAAAHPDRAGPLVLVGCGTFDPGARAALRAALEARTTPKMAEDLRRLPGEILDPDARLAAFARLTLPCYVVDPASEAIEADAYDARGHRESWDDMVRLETEGVHPAAFAAIDSPVLMLHGEQDPHPGGRIRVSLAPHLRRLEYRALPRCGHYPWLERAARAEFFRALRGWLGAAPR